MNTATFRHIKGSQLLAILEKKLKNDFTKDQFFTVTLEKEDGDENLPPEEMISDELIKAVEKSEESYKMGQGTLCKNKQDNDKFLKEVWQ